MIIDLLRKQLELAENDPDFDEIFVWNNGITFVYYNWIADGLWTFLNFSNKLPCIRLQKITAAIEESAEEQWGMYSYDPD